MFVINIEGKLFVKHSPDIDDHVGNHHMIVNAIITTINIKIIYTSKYLRSVSVIRISNAITYFLKHHHHHHNQGGRSWQAFVKRKKCLQFFRRTRIC